MKTFWKDIKVKVNNTEIFLLVLVEHVCPFKDQNDHKTIILLKYRPPKCVMLHARGFSGVKKLFYQMLLKMVITKNATHPHSGLFKWFSKVASGRSCTILREAPYHTIPY